MDNQMMQHSNQYNQSVQQRHRIDADLMKQFVRYLDVKKSSIETYKRGLRQFFEFLQNYHIPYPERENIIFFRDCLIEKGLKPTTVQNYLNSVKLFFQWADQKGFYKDIARHIKAPKISKEHKKEYFTSSQSRELLDIIDTSSVKGKRDYAMLFLMITCGLRSVEVINANVEDMSLHGDNTVLYILGKGRTEKAEYVKITGPVETAIREYLSERGDYLPNDPLFVSTSNNNHNGRITTKAVRNITKQIFKKIGLADRKHSAHSLRHTAVTLALLAGHDINEVKQFARHANIETTLIYDHAIDYERNSCADDITTMILWGHLTLPIAKEKDFTANEGNNGKGRKPKVTSDGRWVDEASVEDQSQVKVDPDTGEVMEGDDNS